MANTEANRHFFLIEPQWRAVQGYAWGFRLPAIAGRMRLRLPSGFDFAALDALMAPFVGENLPDAIGAMSGEMALVQRVLHWSLALQRQAQIAVFGMGHAWGRQIAVEGGVALNTAVPSMAAQASVATLDWVGARVSQFVAERLLSPGGTDVRESFDALQHKLQPFRQKGVNNFRFLRAAHQINIPARGVLGEVYCFGTGSRARLLNSSFTDRTPIIGTQIAQNKQLTAQMLRQAGLPAATHARVESAVQAVQVARQLGYPVVVKPADQEQGRGVSANLKDDASVTAAFSVASRHSNCILVERHAHGHTYRLTVLHGRVLDAKQRVPGGVVGDGRLTVARLVALARQDPRLLRRERERGHVLLQLDDEARSLLAEEGLDQDSIPAAGRFVCLRRRANMSAGGSSLPVRQDAIHPDNRLLAERAAAVLRLDLAGIDLIMPNISRSWLETGALICEINAQPQIGAGTSPRIHEEILQELLGGKARIPLMVVAGEVGALNRENLMTGFPQRQRVAFADAGGVWLAAVRIAAAQPDAFAAAQILLATPQADAAIVVMPYAELRQVGLPGDRCDLLVFAGGAPDDELREMLLPHAVEVQNVALDGVQQACEVFLQVFNLNSSVDRFQLNPT